MAGASAVAAGKVLVASSALTSKAFSTVAASSCSTSNVYPAVSSASNSASVSMFSVDPEAVSTIEIWVSSTCPSLGSH